MFALWLGVRRQRAAERDSEDRYAAQVATERDATERRITELYGRAVEQLGSDKAAVRLGGLYALERLGADHRHLRQTVVNVICAYLRMRYELPEAEGFSKSEWRAIQDNFDQEHHVRQAAQRILYDHVRASMHILNLDREPNPKYWDWLELDLSGATLIDFNLHNARLKTVNFDRAVFKGRSTELRGAWIANEATFEKAQFLAPVYLYGVQFRGYTTFGGARFADVAIFEGATFGLNARFDMATFEKDVSFAEITVTLVAGFEGAIFAGASLFRNATFEGPPKFYAAKFRDMPDFSDARISMLFPGEIYLPGGWALEAATTSVEGEEKRIIRFVRSKEVAEEIQSTESPERQP